MKRILVVLLLTASAFAQGTRYDGTVFNDKGRPTAGALVKICQAAATGTPCSPPANVYSNPGLTVALTNPLTTDSLGRFYFYAASATTYVLQFSGSGITTYTMADVLLPSGSGGGGGNHNLLSSTHSDTTAASGLLGDLIAFNASWGRIAGNTSATLKTLCQTGNGTISALPTWCQLASTNLSDTANLVRNNAANTWTSGAQNFAAAASLIVPNSAGAAPTTSGNFGYDTTANKFKGGVNGATKTFELQENKNVANGYAGLDSGGEVAMAEITVGARLVEVSFSAGATNTWTDMPSAKTELYGASTLRIPIDLTDYTAFRITAGVATGGATNAELRVEYSLDSGANWSYLETGGATAHKVAIGTSGVKTGAWSTKDAAATGDVLIRVVGITGDAAADPVFRHVKVQLR